MRFALIATSVTAALIAPFAANATAPRMSSEAFVEAVRCTAYLQVANPSPELAAQKAYLNAEARRQPAETVVQARNQAFLITNGVVNATQTGMMHQDHASACGPALAAEGDGKQNAV